MEQRTKFLFAEETIRHNISNEIWKQGDKIPSEKQMCSDLGVSRSLLRSVIAKLSSEGLLISKQGAGTFVSRKKVHTYAPDKIGIREQLEQRGYTTSVKLLSIEESEASPILAQHLKLQQSELVYIIRQLRFVDDEPFFVSETYLPKKLFTNINSDDFQNVSCQKAIEEKYGYSINSTNEFLETSIAGSKLAKLLEVPSGYTLLLLEQLNYDISDIPFEDTRIFYRGDRIRLHFDYNR